MFRQLSRLTTQELKISLKVIHVSYRLLRSNRVCGTPRICVCVGVFVCALVNAYVYLCLCACVQACVRVCVCECARASAHARQISFFALISSVLSKLNFFFWGNKIHLVMRVFFSLFAVRNKETNLFCIKNRNALFKREREQCILT